MSAAGDFGAVFAALWVAHQVADHWVQTDAQAAAKGRPGWAGRFACTLHVGSYTGTAVVFLLPTLLLLGVHAAPWRVRLGLLVSAVTHWVIDRRWPLVWLAERTGSRQFVRMGAPREGHDDQHHLGTGAYALDQSAHYAFLFIAALVAVA